MNVVKKTMNQRTLKRDDHVQLSIPSHELFASEKGTRPGLYRSRRGITHLEGNSRMDSQLNWSDTSGTVTCRMYVRRRNEESEAKGAYWRLRASA